MNKAAASPKALGFLLDGKLTVFSKRIFFLPLLITVTQFFSFFALHLVARSEFISVDYSYDCSGKSTLKFDAHLVRSGGLQMLLNNVFGLLVNFFPQRLHH